MSELQIMTHYNVLADTNANKTLYHTYMATKIQCMMDEIVSGIFPGVSADKYVSSHIISLMQLILDNEWTLTEFDTTLKPAIKQLIKYVRKNFGSNLKINILVDRYNSLLELEDGS